MPNSQYDSSGGRTSGALVVLRLLLLAALLLALHFGGSWLTTQFTAWSQGWWQDWGNLLIALWVAIYIIAMALPFVPGVEISLALMMLFGVEGVVLVYSATLAALSLSYWIGRHTPLQRVQQLLSWLHLHKAQLLVAQLAELTPQQQLEFALAKVPLRIFPYLCRHRYLALALLFNLPGNSLLGGGGGIALLAGLSRQFSYPHYLLMLALAIAPVPLLFLQHNLS